MSGPTEASVDLGDPRLARLVLRLGLPATLGISAHAVQMALNSAFVAGLGAEAVGAVAQVQPLALAVAAVGYGLGVGTASLVSRALGAARPGEAGEAAWLGLALTLPAAVIAAAPIVLAAPALLALLGVPGGASPAVFRYAALTVLTTAVMLVHIVGGFVARSEGRAGFSMAVMVGSFGLNAALDALLILRLGWGLEGAGWASLAAQAAAALAYAGFFAFHGSSLRLVRPRGRAAARLARRVAAVGFPATATTLLGALALLLLLARAAGGGEGAVAALGVGLRAVTVTILPVLGLCTGAQAVFGFAQGAGDRRRLRRALRIVLGLSVGYAALAAAGAVGFARPLLAPLAPDAATLGLAVRCSDALHLLLPPTAAAAVCLAFLQAVGAARAAAVLSVASGGLLLAPALLLVPPQWGLDGVLAAKAFAELASGGLALALVRRAFGAGTSAPAPAAAAAQRA